MAEQINWNVFLDKTEYTLEELQEACTQAGDWPTCAVGVQCEVIERYKDTGAPKDEELARQGVKFAHELCSMRNEFKSGDLHIMDRHQQNAKDVLCKIECRSKILIDRHNKLATQTKEQENV